MNYSKKAIVYFDRYTQPTELVVKNLLATIV